MNRPFGLLQRIARKPVAFAFVLIFAGVGVSLIAFSRAAVIATMSLTPASAQPAVDSTFTVTVTENSGTNAVNAVQANLTYDAAKLQFVSIDGTGSAFPYDAEGAGGNGTVKIGRGTTTAVTGQQTVAIVTFKAIAPGAAAVTFGSGSALVQSSDNTDILSGTTGGTYTITDITAPTAPANVAAGTRTATSIGLTWGAATDNVGVTGYNVYRNGTKVGTATGTTYTDSGLAPSNTYNYTVAALDAAGNVSPQSAAVALSTTPDTTAPSVPTGVTSPSQRPTAVVLQWTASTDNVAVTGYRVYRDGAQIGISTTTAYSDGTVAPSTSYAYTVAAYDAAGNLSAQSAVTTVRSAADTTAPSTPTTVSAAAQSTSSVAVTWGASTDNVAVTGYRVYRNGVQVGTTAGLNYVDTALSLGTAYAYTVAAYDAAGNLSAQSAASSITLQYKAGDVSGDNKVDIYDLSVLFSNYNKSSNVTRAMGDLNGDGVINIYDLSLLFTNWNK